MTVLPGIVAQARVMAPMVARTSAALGESPGQ
jgi:hypothetical protein